MRKRNILLLVMVFSSVRSLSQTPPPTPPGRLVDIGGYRLHLNCTGSGSPTVLLEYGATGNSMVWALVQPELARFTRACSYDRAYEGWSDGGPGPQSMHQQIYELHKLLETARIRPPYVAVGWSLGGMSDRLYADAYPGEVRGMVLVDATHEDIAFGDKRFRELFSGKPIPAPQTMKSSPPVALTVEEQKHFDDRKAQKLKESQEPAPDPWNRLKADDLRLWRFADMNGKPISSTKGRQEEWLSEEFQQIHESRKDRPHPLGDIPVVVLGVGKGEGNAHEPARAVQLKDMGTLSTNSEEIIDENSDHGIPLENPELIVGSVKEVFHALKTHTPLAP
jgi:pimeloyl-ACP methyl ester carboxylesterase